MKRGLVFSFFADKMNIMKPSFLLYQYLGDLLGGQIYGEREWQWVGKGQVLRKYTTNDEEHYCEITIIEKP
jgi:hypothetical protein